MTIAEAPVIADHEQQADIAKFDEQLQRYLDGDLPEDAFRVFRLNNGIYGQRQGGHNQMVRVKLPWGGVTPAQLDMLAHIADEYSRGWGHITTRQNVQFHFVQLERVPDLLRDLAVVGLTSREACGDTVRNIQGCHLAGACPFEVLDISPWAEATHRYFLRHPYGQRLPRKFKINFSGCNTDCGQAMFNDVGVVAAARRRDDGSIEPGFRVYLAGGLGANPHPAQALEDFTSREDLLLTIEAILRTFDHYGNRENKLRARLKWLVDQIGIDELRDRVKAERKLLIAAARAPIGIPDVVKEWGDAPAGRDPSVDATPVGDGVAVEISGSKPFDRWKSANVVIGEAKGTVSALGYAELGDLTSHQLREVARIAREGDYEVRVTNRQNLVFRGLTHEQLPALHAELEALGMAAPGAELARDVVSCPGADTCNLAVTQSRGLASDIGAALEDAGLAEVGGIRVNISGCTNSCGQHHASDIGFFGVERRAHGRAAPGYTMLLGGHVANESVRFGEKALRLPAKNASAAVVRIVGRYRDERHPAQTFQDWLEAAGGASAVGETLADLDEFPSPEEAPDFYTDFGEAGPYVKEIGASECAT
jgi:sulfite reductase beta subunit-like hemoprotein